MPNKILYKETQKNFILLIAAIVFALFFTIMSIVQIGFNKPIGNHPAPDALLVIFAIGSILATILMNRQNLVILITADEIRISFGILTSETVVYKKDIKQISIRKYDALKEFSGWGVRFNDKESCFTVSGHQALEIELANQSKLLIGTQQAEKLQAVIDQYFVGL